MWRYSQKREYSFSSLRLLVYNASVKLSVKCLQKYNKTITEFGCARVMLLFSDSIHLIREWTLGITDRQIYYNYIATIRLNNVIIYM